ncbi:LytTR family transcriptional regulator DNA-binding domain-containing protein [Qipengyuania sp. S6317L1]|nr:LytTR family transcriptional regulator DNA-binding domain-containing protein [Qipengyuania sp. S6317L1]
MAGSLRIEMIETPGQVREPQDLSGKAAFWRGLLSDLAIMTGIGLFLGVLGPFGSSDLPLGVRLLSWLAFAYVGYVCYRPLEPLVSWGARTLHLPRIGLWIAAAAIATVPMTFAVLVLGNLHNPFRWPGLDIALTSYFYVFIVGAAVTLFFNVLGLRSGKKPAFVPAPAHAPAPASASATASEPDPPAKTNALLDQLPASLGSDVIALEMEDHYVRVHTALGSELVLMRLRDAIVHVAEIDGRQVHRSWWVARLAVEDVRREGRNVRLVLPGGLEAPVSRAQVSELKDAGWI